MTLNQITYFLEVCKTLHYTRAAKNLNISQPSLSYSIKQLENELGVSLFRKENKKVYITEYGKIFKPYCERAIDNLMQGIASISEANNPYSGNIRIGYVYSTGSSIVPNLIDSFHQHRGDNNITFLLKMANSPSIIENIKDNILDFGILPMISSEIDGINAFPIYRQELFVIVSKNHKLAKNEFTKIKDLKGEKIVALDRESDLYERTKIIFHKENLKPNFYYDVDELNTMAAFVSADMGIGITPHIPALSSYDVIIIPFENHIIQRNIYLIWNNKIDQRPVLKNFLNFVKISK